MKYLLAIATLVSTTVMAQVPVTVSTKPHQTAQPVRVPKIKLLRSNPHRLTAIRFQGTSPYDAPDDEFLCSGTVRRPKVVKPEPKLDDELSDYVVVRLAVARARALERYRQVHG